AGASAWVQLARRRRGVVLGQRYAPEPSLEPGGEDHVDSRDDLDRRAPRGGRSLVPNGGHPPPTRGPGSALRAVWSLPTGRRDDSRRTRPETLDRRVEVIDRRAPHRGGLVRIWADHAAGGPRADRGRGAWCESQ